MTEIAAVAGVAFQLESTTTAIIGWQVDVGKDMGIPRPIRAKAPGMVAFTVVDPASVGPVELAERVNEPATVVRT